LKLSGVLSEGLLRDGDGVERSGTVFDVGYTIGALLYILSRGDLIEQVGVADARLRQSFVFERFGGTSLIALVASWIFGVPAVFCGW